MSSAHSKKSSFTFDKFLLDIAKPAYFGLIGLIHKLAFLAVFLGLLGYFFAQLKAQNIDLIQLIFHPSSSFQFIKTK